MRTFNIVIERDPDTNLYVGYVPGWPGAHSQGATLAARGGTRVSHHAITRAE
jgi:predicted RNase H-like HicB family nuclease